LFIEFVPNLANDISDAAPWAIYGLAMLLLMYAMPRGVAGSAGLLLQRFQSRRTASGERDQDHKGRMP
jgi:branched-chain amino acid transport system permease protein